MPLTFSEDLVGTRIAGTLDALCYRYPIAETWLLGARTDPAATNPVTVPGLRLILLPPDRLGTLECWIKNGLCQVPAHEFAHVLMLASQLEAVGGDFKQLPQYLLPELERYRRLSPDERSNHLYTPPNAIGRLVAAARQEGPVEPALGPYAAEDHMEFFAEVMRAYWSHEPSDGALPAVVSKIGESVDELYAR